MHPWLAAQTLAWREFIRFARQRNRLIGAVGQPVLFWVLFGAGLGPSFRLRAEDSASVTYREYFFPGTLVLILLFTAIFATISIIEDRREGFLQSVLVAPVPRWSLVLGKLLGGTAIAMAQGLLFLALGLMVGLPFSWTGLGLVVVFSALIAFGLTALGFVIAWRMDSTQGFHAIMSIFLMPMWLLSGAFFPANEGWLGWVLRVNPLTYGVAGVRHLLYWSEKAHPSTRDLPSLGTCVGVTILFAVCMFVVGCRISARRTVADLV